LNILGNLLNPAALRHEILQATPGEFWASVFITAALAATGFYFAFIYFSRARLIEDTPTSRIRSAAQGYVELVGLSAMLDGPDIIAPLSKIPCTWFRYKVEELYDKRDEVIESGTSEDLFMLVGKTGGCVIDPDGAIVTPTIKRTWYGNTYDGQIAGNQLFGTTGRYRFSEERIHPGDRLFVMGLFQSVGGADEVFNSAQEIRDLLRKWKQQPEKLLQYFDKNKDGQIDAVEWENVRKMAGYFIRKRQGKRNLQPVTHLLKKPENTKQPFMISTKSQHALVANYKLYSGLCFAGFLISGSLVAWMCLVRF